MKKIDFKTLSWGRYDFANSSYVVVLQSFLLPGLFSSFLLGNSSLGSRGLANGISTIVGTLLGVLIGHYLDKNRKLTVLFFSIIVVLIFMGILVIAYASGFSYGLLYRGFIITNSLFLAANALYYSMLPSLTTNSSDSFIKSGFARGWGYVGGIISLVIAILLQRTLGVEYSPIIFASIGIFYAIFSWLSIKGLRKIEFQPTSQGSQHNVGSVKMSTKQIVTLLFGYRCISEVITVVLMFFTPYATGELGLSLTMVGVIMLGVQLIAFPATWRGGSIISKLGESKSLAIMVLGRIITILLLVFDTGYIGIMGFVLIGSLVVGNTQSFLRAQYSNLIDQNNRGLHFGLYLMVAEAASSLGPIMYGYLSDYLGSQKIPLLVFGVIMVVGYFIIHTQTKYTTYQ